MAKCKGGYDSNLTIKSEEAPPDINIFQSTLQLELIILIFGIISILQIL